MPALCSLLMARRSPAMDLWKAVQQNVQLLSQEDFMPPSTAECLFFNSRSVFTKIHGSALLKLHGLNLDRSPLLIFPDHTFRQGCLQHRYHCCWVICLGKTWQKSSQTPVKPPVDSYPHQLANCRCSPCMRFAGVLMVNKEDKEFLLVH